jgi:hypothetical protein
LIRVGVHDLTGTRPALFATAATHCLGGTAFWPARVAARKGQSFLLFFLFSLLFFPAALIVAFMVRDRRVAAIA